MDNLKADGLQNTDSDKQTVLMVFDNRLNLLDKVTLPLGGSNFVKILPLK
jgi:hypothetical protein